MLKRRLGDEEEKGGGQPQTNSKTVEQGINQQTIDTTNTSTMIMGIMRHPFIDGIVETHFP